MKNGWPWASVVENLIDHPVVWVGLSGGMDSMVLLHALANIKALKGKLKAIHVNHGLSPNADDWQVFCQQQCDALFIPLVIETLHLKPKANLEAIAREKRYQKFLNHISSGDALVLAHHLDDQIETFFLNFLRGCGLSGLAAMPSERVWHEISIHRPLLSHSRKELLDYANQQKIDWIEDESNIDLKYSRNFLRHQVLPLIEKHWPHYRQSVNHTIDSCQTTVKDLKHRALIDYPQLMLDNEKLSIRVLQALPKEQIFIVIRLWLEQQHISMPPQKLLEALLEQMIFRKRKDSQPVLNWEKWQFRCYQDDLYLRTLQKESMRSYCWSNFPKPLVIYKGHLIARSSNRGIVIKKGQQPQVRFRDGGEQILLNGHHRQLKKLMQQWKIPSFERDTIPLLYVGDELVAVVGYVYADCNKDSSAKRFEIDWEQGVNSANC